MVLKTILIITCLLNLLVVTIKCQTENQDDESLLPNINLRDVEDTTLNNFLKDQQH